VWRVAAFVDQVTGRGIDANIDPAVLATLTEAAALPALVDLGEARSRYRRTSQRRSLAPPPIADAAGHDIVRSDGSALAAALRERLAPGLRSPSEHT
jgi:hypothetical protein